MSIKDHKDYNYELQNLEYTIDYMKKFYEVTLKNKLHIDKQVEYGIRHYNSDNAEQFNELVISSKLQESLKKKIMNITKTLEKPYFARVDFTESDNDKLQELYIGKLSLIRDEDLKFLIVDWRAPIATLYYEGRLGSASYYCPDGNIEGNLSLKRQYTVENGSLTDYVDIDITTNDSFLQASLGNSVDNRLKDIVTTIQAEQNRVIRSELWKPLIVQGAAGGGKTTIALHRIAYLLYNYEDEIKPENFLIIAPNRFFLSYISDVLPELGVENVVQSTFEDFAINFINKKLKLTSPYDKISTLINKDTNDAQINMYEISKFKSSLDFMRLLELYMKTIEENFLPKEDFKIQSFTLLSHEKLLKLFLEDYKNYPYTKRINELKKYLINSIKYKKDLILSKIDNAYDKKLFDIKKKMNDSPKRRELITKLLDSRDSLLQDINKNSKTIVKEYLSKILNISPIEYYKDFLNNLDDLSYDSLNIDGTLVKNSMIYSMKILSSNKFENEDLAPLMLIKHLVLGSEEKFNLKHIVIDEAQDFSLFQLFILKKIINRNAFTILGDLCQGIHSYRGINDWNDVCDYIFNNKSVKYLTLEQSYRTTIEIMNCAKKVLTKLNLNDLPPCKPVIRHGKEVTIKEFDSLELIAQEISIILNSLKDNKFNSAAIICKTIEECKIVNELLNLYNHKATFITESECNYSGGIVIIPSYLAKGLEFDVVIVANACEKNYTTSDMDIKLLYVAMTRPLHELYIYSHGKMTSLL